MKIKALLSGDASAHDQLNKRGVLFLRCFTHICLGDQMPKRTTLILDDDVYKFPVY
jgi:hypothetical protein